MGKCNYCGSVSHPSFKCFNKPRKEIERISQLTNRPSRKRSAETVIYNRNKDIYISRNDVCEYPGCESNLVTLHHVSGRTGDLYTDIDNFMSLCPDHHTWAENNPKEAKAIGLAKSRLDTVYNKKAGSN